MLRKAGGCSLVLEIVNCSLQKLPEGVSSAQKTFPEGHVGCSRERPEVQRLWVNREGACIDLSPSPHTASIYVKYVSTYWALQASPLCRALQEASAFPDLALSFQKNK